MGNGAICGEQQSDQTTHCCGTCGCHNCGEEQPIPSQMDYHQVEMSDNLQPELMKSKMSLSNQQQFDILIQSQQIQVQQQLLNSGRILDATYNIQRRPSNSEMGQFFSPKSAIDNSFLQSQNNQFIIGGGVQPILSNAHSLAQSQISNNLQLIIDQQLSKSQQQIPQSQSFLQQQIQNQNIASYQEYQQQQLEFQQQQLLLSDEQNKQLALQNQQDLLMDQEKIFQAQQLQFQNIYKLKLQTELLQMVKHQSLDEPLLPQYHLYFDQLVGQDGHDTTPDQYHGPVYMLQHKLNPSYRLCMKVITIQSYTEWELKEREFHLQKLEFTHPHLVNIHLIHSRKFLCLCSATFRICLLYDFIHTDLMQIAPTRHFYEDELWNILDNMIDTLYVLQLKGIAHQNVKLSHLVLSRTIDDKMIYKILFKPDEKKMMDQLMAQGKGQTYTPQSPPPSLRDEKTNEPLYISPFQWKLILEKQDKTPELQNQVKSDVFTLGMIILHLALGPGRHQMLPEVYEADGINGHKIIAFVRTLKEHYSQELVDVLNLMLKIDEYDRPDWISLSEKMSGLHQRQVFAHSLGTDNYIYTLELQKRQEQRLLLLKQSDIKANQSQKYKSKTDPQSLQISIVPSHLSDIKYSRFEKTHIQEEEEFVIDQFLQNTQTVEQRGRKQFTFGDCTYDGEMVNGKRDGIGQAQFLDGKMYDGCWKYDEPNGQGIMYAKDGVQIYQGLFKKGKYNGFGVQHNSNAHISPQPFNFTDFSKLKDLWIKYEGDQINGNWHGFGCLQLTNKEKFVGAFADGLPQGVGVFQTIDSQYINGQWDIGVLIKRM